MKNLEEMQNEALIRIVDDDADLRKGLTFMLECAGWKSAAYPSARDFLTQDSPSIPGCLILDVQMAGMTGIELQHEMNRRGNTLPIIFLTGHGDIDMAVTAMIDGAANFIQKPPESGKLLAAIETCVSQSLKNAEGTSSPAVLRQRLSLLTRRPSLSKYFLIANQEGTEKINGHPISARKEKSNPRENPFQGDYG